MTEVWATMATIPERAASRAMAIESLLPQVDRLIITFCHETGDQGKFDCCAQADDVYILGVDDDLVYPPDYVAATVNQLEQDRDRIVGWHGFTLNEDGSRHTTYPCLGEVDDPTAVDVIGTGVIGFHASVLPLEPADFPTRNAAMFWVAVKAAKLGLPLVVLPHSGRWFPAWVEYQKTMWSETAKESGSFMDYSQTMQQPLAELVAMKEWPEQQDEPAELVAA